MHRLKTTPFYSGRLVDGRKRKKKNDCRVLDAVIIRACVGQSRKIYFPLNQDCRDRCVQKNVIDNK